MTESLTSGSGNSPKPGRWRRFIGYLLLVISTITWFGGLLGAPFLPLSAARRLAVGGSLILIGEITFWAAVPFLGKEMVMLFRRYLNPMRWFKKKEAVSDSKPEIAGEPENSPLDNQP